MRPQSELWFEALGLARRLAGEEGGPRIAPGNVVTLPIVGCSGAFMIRALRLVGLLAPTECTESGSPFPPEETMAPAFAAALPALRVRNRAYWTAFDVIFQNDSGNFEGAWARLARAGRQQQRLEAKERTSRCTARVRPSVRVARRSSEPPAYVDSVTSGEVVGAGR